MAAMNPQKKFSMADLNAVNYEMLVDVPIKVTVELGRSQMTVQEILGLEKGSVIELDRIAGDPVDVFVNDYLIAKGEVVVVDDNFGVRITKIIASHSLVGKN
jgi:flagellar motor switch protein FliN/FliY